MSKKKKDKAGVYGVTYKDAAGHESYYVTQSSNPDAAVQRVKESAPNSTDHVAELRHAFEE